MNNRTPAPQSSGLNLGDIYHVLFRHKWKIMIIWLIGIGAAAALWKLWPVKYQSQAKLFVRYVLDNKSLSPVGPGNIQTPDSRGTGIMNSEVQILNSFDIAEEVADAIGPSNILAKVGGGTNRIKAAGVISKGLTVDAPKGSAVIFLTFEHPDPTIVQPVLSQLIADYLKKQAAVHQADGTLDDVLTQQTDQLRTQLQQTEQDLRNAKLKVGVISLEDTKKAYADRILKIQDELADAQGELAANNAALTEMTNLMSSKVQSTNAAPQSPAQPAPPPDKVTQQYKSVCSLLNTLQKKEQNLLLQFTPKNAFVQTVQKQIADNQATKAKLEKQYPDLVGSQVLAPDSPDQPAVTRKDLVTQLTKAKALHARIDVLNKQLTDIQNRMDTVAYAEGNISSLQRKLAIQATNYMALSENLQKTRLDEQLSAGRISNINEIESPTPPAPAKSKQKKVVALTLVGSIAGAVALAFLLELYLDRSIKRPVEIEGRLSAPLFLSIPRTRLNGKHTPALPPPNRRLIGNGSPANAPAANGDSPPSGLPATAETSPPPASHPALRSYFETLRDRLILYFESKNLIHKPKLVAVTSCANGSGVSTVASGLAECLSETGDGNVLLVDMNEVNGSAAAHFRKGKLECDLDDALQAEKREHAQVQDNLYVVSENPNNRALSRILHKRFSNLIPKMRASDYDYIIFDMPPVSQISPTPRLARFMDMVFMVVEAERTDREVVKRATDLLTASKADVGVVLNKHRKYVPKALQQEL